METNVIYNGNCMDMLCDVEDESIDLVILDPNYDDWDRLCEGGLICQSVRVLKRTGNILMFTKQPFDFNLRNEVDYMFRREMVWTFTNGGAWVSNKMPLVSFQKIYWCTPTEEFYFDPRTGLDYSTDTKDFKRSEKVFGGYREKGKNFQKSDDGIWLRDHLHYNKPECGSIPAKPLDLIRIFLRCFCPIGGIVLDPFIGSGTTAFACIKENRNFIGIEMDKDRFQETQKRIELERRQLSLF